jgi:excinuclease ABC subunit B
VIIVASVSCIYNIGSPENYENVSLEIKAGQKMKRKDFLLLLSNLQYQRNDIEFKPGSFRVRGDIIEINLVTGEKILRIEFFGDKIEIISEVRPHLNLTYKKIKSDFVKIFPATFWVAEQSRLKIAVKIFSLNCRADWLNLKSLENYWRLRDWSKKQL